MIEGGLALFQYPIYLGDEYAEKQLNSGDVLPCFLYQLFFHVFVSYLDRQAGGTCGWNMSYPGSHICLSLTPHSHIEKAHKCYNNEFYLSSAFLNFFTESVVAFSNLEKKVVYSIPFFCGICSFTF